jgi:hypothetical protein
MVLESKSYFVFQISVPMSVEFEELAKLRDNPSDEQASKYYVLFKVLYVIEHSGSIGSSYLTSLIFSHKNT